MTDENDDELGEVEPMVIGETEGADDYVSISGSPRSVVELLRLLIGFNDYDDEADE